MDAPRSSDHRMPSSERYSIAIITLEEQVFREMRRMLAPSFRTTLASTESQIKFVIDDPDLHGIVLDLESIGNEPADGIEVLREMRRLRDDLIMVAITQSTGPELSLQASQAGADHFFLKPVDYEQLRGVLLQTAEKRALQSEGKWLLEQVAKRAAFCGLIGGSEPMRKVYQAIEAVAGSNASIVIRGESGVGKELVARAVVQSGDRRDQPYICLNCSALPDTLMESELFGHERGAFTGADIAKPGMIELAHKGTLFLDEITTLNPALQSKLLRVLQEHSIQRLGCRTTKKIDFRLITATNDDLEDMVSKGRFREDLYYRINVVPIFVPPLRDRGSDISLLVEHFVRLYCTANRKPQKQVQPEVLEILEHYSWPGNVRELENAIERAVVLGSADTILPEDLPEHIRESHPAEVSTTLYEGAVEEAKRKVVLRAFEQANYEHEIAAKILGLHPNYLHKLIRTMDLKAALKKAGK
jgi:DNA-binding NtrC family response regulator